MKCFVFWRSDFAEWVWTHVADFFYIFFLEMKFVRTIFTSQLCMYACFIIITVKVVVFAGVGSKILVYVP